jgi:3-oxoacyl-[acyl-carrier protein] reductase
MDLHLTGKTAIVTGASTQGCGSAIAKALAREGVAVAITARRADALKKLAAEIKAEGNIEPVVLPADLYDPETPQRLAADARQAMGHVGIVVYAAGGNRSLTLDAPRERWDEGMAINFFRLRELAHALLPGMIENKWGRIISLTGTAEPLTLNVANPAKAAVQAWSKGLSRDVGKYGVTLNCIVPGRILSEQIMKREPDEAARRAFAQREIAVGRYGDPSELADLVTYLASPRASYITGAVIPVDGGLKRYAH